jgi:NADPH:quinone reductase-like Zn-dependent oxidoreductase
MTSRIVNQDVNMAQMRAVLIRDGKGPADNLYIGNAPKPNPGSEQVLVKESHLSFLLLNRFPFALQVKAFGINRMDSAQREGRYPIPKGAPEILGVEFSGTIAELGTGVSDWAVNDEVLGLAVGVIDCFFFLW